MDESTSSKLESAARAATDEVIRAEGAKAAAGAERLELESELQRLHDVIARIYLLASKYDAPLNAAFYLGAISEIAGAEQDQDDEPTDE